MGNPLKIVLIAGQVHDVTIAPTLISDLKPEIVMADGSYDSLEFREQIRVQGATACIKPRKNRKMILPFDKEQYKERHLVNVSFKIKKK